MDRHDYFLTSWLLSDFFEAVRILWLISLLIKPLLFCCCDYVKKCVFFSYVSVSMMVLGSFFLISYLYFPLSFYISLCSWKSLNAQKHSKYFFGKGWWLLYKLYLAPNVQKLAFLHILYNFPKWDSWLKVNKKQQMVVKITNKEINIWTSYECVLLFHYDICWCDLR